MMRVRWASIIRILILSAVLPVLASLILCGCVSIVRPVGEWARPADLQLHENSLAGVRVAVRCGSIDSAGDIKERDRKVCRALETALSSIGAEIINEDVDATSAPLDLTLWYLDRGSGVESCPTLLGFGHVMSGYWIPCKSSEWSEAELRVTDGRGVVLERAPLRVEKVDLTSLLFVPSSFDQKQRSKARARVLQSRFIQFAQNRVYSQSLRLPGRLEKEAPWN